MTTNLFNENNILLSKAPEQVGNLQNTNANKSTTDKGFANLLDSLKDNLNKTKETTTTQNNDIAKKDNVKNSGTTNVKDDPNQTKDTSDIKTSTADNNIKTTDDDIKTVKNTQTTTQDAEKSEETETKDDDKKIEITAQDIISNILITTNTGTITANTLQTELKNTSTDTETETDASKVNSGTTAELKPQTPKTDADGSLEGEITVSKEDSTDITNTQDANIEIKEEALDNLVKVDESVDTETTNIKVIDENQKPTDEKAADKINQEILDDLDTKIKSVSKQTDTSSFSNSGNSRGNAQEDAIKYTIKGLDNLSTTSQVENSSVQNAFGKTLDSTATVKEAQKPDVMNQINSKLEAFKDESVSKVNIILKPESLGKINIEIMNSKDGLTARIIAQTPEARDILNKNIESLKNTIQTQGVNVNNVSVKIDETQNAAQNSMNFEQEAFNKQFSNQNGQNSENSKYGTANTTAEGLMTSENIEPEEERISTHNGSVNISV